MNAEERLKPLIEAMIFASDRPIGIDRLSNLLEGEKREDVRAALNHLQEEYDRQGRGIYIEEVAGGYQMRTRPEYAPWLRRLLKVGSSKMSRASMETLAIIAYKQPLTRFEIEKVRGVDSSGVLRTLLEKNMVKVVGRKDVPGRPAVYGTTKDFLEAFELRDLSCLPKLSEIRGVREKDGIGEVAEGDSQSWHNIEAQSGGVDSAGEGGGKRGSADTTGDQG